MRVCFFGDSFVNGYGDPEHQGWVGRLCRFARAQGHDMTSYNCGIRRATSTDIKTRWLDEALARLPEEHKGAVVFSFGANDRQLENGHLRVPHDQLVENTHAILSAATARWPTLFVMSPEVSRADADAAAQGQAISAICAELSVPVFDALAASAHFTHWRAEAEAGDGAHPGAKGYEELALLLNGWPAWQGLLDTLSR